MDVFAGGCDGQLWHRGFHHGGWQPWEVPSGSGQLLAGTDVSVTTLSSNGPIVVAVVDSGSNIKFQQCQNFPCLNSVNGWTTWENPGMEGFTANVSPISLGGQVANPFVPTNSGVFSLRGAVRTSNWTASTISEPDLQGSTPRAVPYGAFGELVFYQDQFRHASCERWFNTGWATSGDHPIGKDVFLSDPFPVTGVGAPYLFGIKSDETVWYTAVTNPPCM
jgi:hypothetical protein